MSEASVLRLARTRPLLFAVLETLLTGACALVWFAFAGLLHLADGTHEGGDPTRLPAGAFALAAGIAAASLVLTWGLRCVPSPALRRIVDRLILFRAAVVLAAGAGVLVFAVLY
ncbi:hypothetical protein [Streptomyces sp. NPDC126514]|uniref:hypothetical protein n=1 Tax=Streptomyces sp. NPDC126514 TaxID=3155210 RepID=UPI003317F3CD